MEIGDLLEVGVRLTPQRIVRWFAMAAVLVVALVPTVRDAAITAWTDYQTPRLMERLEPVLPTPSASHQGG